jgi:tRNA-Thr(GGU) m(6)t(6)A37 methyltransferase TsaA
MDLRLRPIGVLRTPFSAAPGTPIQPAYAGEAKGEVRVHARFRRALDDLEGFEYVWLLTWLDRSGPWRSRVVPFRDVVPRGLFATRAPSRPNPIGLSVVRLLGREDCVLRVAGVDLLDRTPLLDIKPYVPRFDAHPRARAGWLERAGCHRRRDDGRFAPADRA